MEDNQFVCTFQDCNLSFSTQYLLNIHKKKHEMVLSLHRTTVSVADETPTPVRFMRNCEEIGLFQDLQNVNPFEETFRKAAEGIKKGTFKPNMANGLSRSAGDDLHTPHVFPEIHSDVAHSLTLESTKNNSSTDEVVVITEADTSVKTATPVPPIDTNSDSITTQTASEQVQVLVRMPDGSYLQLMAKQIKQPTPTLPAMKSISERTDRTNTTIVLNSQPPPQALPVIESAPKQALVKQKLKAFLDGSNKSKSSDPRNLIESQKCNVIGREKQVDERTNTSRNQGKDSVEEDQEKRKQILERNRKAACRSREKRKQWVKELMKRAEATTTANRALAREVTALRGEVLQLQSLLAMHNNCSVTLAAADGSLTVPPSIVLTVPEVSCSPRISRRDGLTLDIDRASSNTLMDLDSPVVRKDAVLASVTAPPTPDEQRLVAFPELERVNVDSETISDDRISSATTVIQFNPNVLKHHNFS